MMSTPTIESGLKGTLPPEEYATKPMPSWGPAFDQPHGTYGNMDYVSVTFATDADKAAALIPQELELINIPMLPGQSAANLVFAKYRECSLGPYMEVIVSIPVLHKGLPYLYVPAIYVDNDAALIAGRELGGYPKKMAQITMRNYGNVFQSQMSRGSMQEKTADPNYSDLASTSVTKGDKLLSVPLAADTAAELPPPYDMLLPQPPPTGEPQDYVLTTMALRRFPGIGPGPNGLFGADVLQLVATPWRVSKAEIYAGDAASIEFYPSEEDPIAQLLPVNSVLGAWVLRGDMYTELEDWRLIEDLKKNKAS
jgi:hypothetical protein